VIAGEAVTGVSIMGVVQALDAGPVFATVERLIGPDDTTVEVEHDLAVLGARLLVDVVDALADGLAHAVPQDESGVTYASRVEKEEGLIDWTLTAVDIHNRVRGLQPWPMAWTSIHGRRLVVVRTRHVAEPAGEAESPGTVLAVLGDALRVSTGCGRLDIVAVQPEGRRVMTVRDFLAGSRVTAGTSLR
jgi:methionyl-tRNA formyltransferase